MQLSTPSVRKLLRENISDKPAMRVEETAIDSLLADIRDRLTALAGVEEEFYHGYSDEKNRPKVMRFKINEPGNTDHMGWFRQYILEVRVNPENNQLEFKPEYRWQSLADPDELVPYIRAYQAGLQRRRAKANKQQKLRDLKTHAMIAQIKAIAKEEQFDFATDSDTVKLKLFVKISDNEAMQIHIPFSKFQELLPQIRFTIRSLREVHAAGIQFKLGRYRPMSAWIRHQDL